MKIFKRLRFFYLYHRRKINSANCAVWLLFSLFASCGKKAKELKSESSKDTQTTNPLTVLKLKASLKTNGESISGEKQFENYSMIKIPQLIKLSKGKSSSEKSRIYINVKEDSYEFYCDYYGYLGDESNEIVNQIINDNGLKLDKIYENKAYVLDDCFNQDGRRLGFPAGYEYPIDSDKKIKLSILGANSEEDAEGFTEIEYFSFE